MSSDIFIPNAFTPDGEAPYNQFMPFFAFEPLQFKMIIYNRSGGEIFETENPQEGWNGKLKGGISAIEGVYVYFITFTSDDGEKFFKKGSFSLIYR
jgi:gliding motility-associated-like protein